MLGKIWIRGGLTGAVLLVLGSVPVEGQNVEAILRAGERLELTEQQVQELDRIRSEIVAERTAEMARMAELRSQLAAGQIRRSEVMAAMEDQQEARQGRAEQRRASIASILTEEQLQSVQQMRRRVDRQRAGAGRARPGGGRGGRGLRPGGRQGFAPGFGPRGRGDFGPGARRGADLGEPGGPREVDQPSEDAVIGLR